jgi:hypothetical protein
MKGNSNGVKQIVSIDMDTRKETCLQYRADDDQYGVIGDCPEALWPDSREAWSREAVQSAYPPESAKT